MKCQCAECGITKTKFVSNKSGSKSGSGIFDGLLKGGVKGGPYRIDFKKGFQLLSDPGLFKVPLRQNFLNSLFLHFLNL